MIGLLLAIIYLSFISLGLPDAVLGSAWPLMSESYGTSISSMGIVTIIISAGTIVSSLFGHRLTHTFGVHKVTCVSVGLTAVALFGFATSSSFLILCLWAIPYGMGAGSVDAALNNYVALHFESKHMSWLHCMWGLGATTGPYIMSMALSKQIGFQGGYFILFGIQILITLAILLSAPIWKLHKTEVMSQDSHAVNAPISLRETFRIKGVKQIAIAFFCFCAIEQTAGLWASSYLIYQHGMEAERAVGFTALFYLGITVGRGINGFLAMKYKDEQMIRGGAVLMAVGVVILLFPLGQQVALVGIALIGLGSAPVYPCIIHSTPKNFGTSHSSAITGVQMASAYTGTLFMPAIFGIIGRSLGFVFYPIYIALLLLCMVIMYEKLMKMLTQ